MTSDDLQAQWQQIHEAVVEQVEHKVAGVSTLTLGLLVAGAGALGVAYYLGRRNAEGPPRHSEPPLAPRVSRPARPVVSSALEPLVEQTLRSVVTAVIDRLRQPPAPR